MTDDETPETTPYCRIVTDADSDEKLVEVILPDGDGGCVAGRVSADEARSITLGLRSTAAAIDGRPFFDGSWNTAYTLRHAADELETLREEFDQ